MESRVTYQKKKRKKKKKKLRFRKWVIVVFLIFFLSIFLVSASKVFNWFNDNNKVDNITEDILENVKVKEKKDNENTENINPPEDKWNDYWDYIKMNLLEIDFNQLLKRNSDTVGWIEVKGTNINYPIVQTTDNNYYLTHAFDKTENEAGWVFMDYRNDPVNFNQNTIIYAHSRLTGSMFGSLKNILDSSWYTNKNNHIIRLSTTTENTMWQVFSVYTIPKESYYITPSFNSNEAYLEFLNTIKSRSEVDFSGTVNTNDKILTLSTCKDNFGNRVVMHAKLIKKEAR
ncbi:MAG TPA: class B sortase [Candidatus Onthousia excrementipullorum]|uniref:Class B sortase n=1 Tax=Candidatus Onthousia excrementipullorum TaxID=2840884 RepID=A0A9D1J3L0_9FIRM|nr:class B sortase [Candidatus Onthousia excrementipullorum]